MPLHIFIICCAGAGCFFWFHTHQLKKFDADKHAMRVIVYIAEMNQRSPEDRDRIWEVDSRFYKWTNSYRDGISFDSWKVSVVRELTKFYYDEIFPSSTPNL